MRSEKQRESNRKMGGESEGVVSGTALCFLAAREPLATRKLAARRALATRVLLKLAAREHTTLCTLQ